MSTPLRPRTSLRRNSSLQSAVSSSSLDSIYSSSKPTIQSQENSQLKPSSFLLLPPPSQSSKSKVDKRKKRERTSSTSTLTPSLSHGSSKRDRPESRPVGVPRPPTATKSKRKRDSGNHSTSSPSSSVTLSATPLFTPNVDPRIEQSLATTPWSLIDPENHFLLSSSRLFQLSHLELGEITRQQNQGRDPKYGEVKKQRGSSINAQGNKKKVREVLDRLERERLERLGVETTDKKGKGKELPEPSWARDRDGIEWETSILKKLSSRLSSSKSEDFIPLAWANDLETKVKKASLGSLECWVLGKEFPCKRVVLVGWILEKEWRESDGRRMWIYTIDDGTGLVQVICPIDDNNNHYDSRNLTNPQSIKPTLDPKLLIPKFCLPSASHPSSSSAEFKLKRSYSHLEDTSTSNNTTFSPQTLVRVVGSITPPSNIYQTELRVTAERMESVSPNQEIQHHSIVNKLWNEVYSKEVDVRGMLERIEREEKELKRQRELEPDTSSASTSSYGDLSSSSASSTSDPIRKYRPTRPSKLSSDDITLTNFVIYIRHHLVKHHVQPSSSSSSPSLFTPPPSSQSSLHCPPPPSSSQDLNRQREEWCVPFDIDSLRSSNKHLELFARRLSLERDRKEREKKKRQRKRQKMDGDFTLLDCSNADKEREGVWISGKKRVEGGIVEKRGREKVGTMGSSKLVSMMLPPPSVNATITRSVKREVEEEFEEELERELVGKKLDKEIKRCWEDAIRLMRKNGMLVEYVPNEGEEEEEEIKSAELNWVENDRGRRSLPDEPRSTRHGINYTRYDSGVTPGRSASTSNVSDSRDEDTPRASRLSHNSLPLASTSTDSRQRFQLVTPVSLAPLILEHLQDLSHSNYASSSSRSSRRSITELDVRLSLYRDDRWSAVAKYGEVVRRSLELLEEWGEIVQKGEGYKLA
ncbi:hypothetical protein JCM3765_005228 [Sporobolomyces pararoseus]